MNNDNPKCHICGNPAFKTGEAADGSIAWYCKRCHDGPQVMGLSPEPFRRDEPKTGRNALCPCGSGRKFKKCCMGAS